MEHEWLWGLDDDERDFLMQVSVLDWLSGPSCAAVSDRDDAGEVLHRLWHERLLVIPLDRRESAYRMHALLQNALTAQLERSDLEALHIAHQRASTFFEATDDADRAIRHAIAAQDLDRAERLVAEHTPFAFTNGLYATIGRWIEAFPRDRVLRSPALCLSAALAALGLGDVAGGVDLVATRNRSGRAHARPGSRFRGCACSISGRRRTPARRGRLCRMR